MINHRLCSTIIPHSFILPAIALIRKWPMASFLLWPAQCPHFWLMVNCTLHIKYPCCIVIYLYLYIICDAYVYHFVNTLMWFFNSCHRTSSWGIQLLRVHTSALFWFYHCHYQTKHLYCYFLLCRLFSSEYISASIEYNNNTCLVRGLPEVTSIIELSFWLC